MKSHFLFIKYLKWVKTWLQLNKVDLRDFVIKVSFHLFPRSSLFPQTTSDWNGLPEW